MCENGPFSHAKIRYHSRGREEWCKLAENEGFSRTKTAYYPLGGGGVTGRHPVHCRPVVPASSAQLFPRQANPASPRPLVVGTLPLCVETLKNTDALPRIKMAAVERRGAKFHAALLTRGDPWGGGIRGRRGPCVRTLRALIGVFFFALLTTARSHEHPALLVLRVYSL